MNRHRSMRMFTSDRARASRLDLGDTPNRRRTAITGKNIAHFNGTHHQPRSAHHMNRPKDSTKRSVAPL